MILRFLLGEIMTSMGFITVHQLDEALQKQRRILKEKALPEQLQRARLVSDARSATDGTSLLGQILIDMGFATSEQLKEALREQEKTVEAYKSLESEKLGTAIEVGFMINSTLELHEVLALIMRHANRVTRSIASTLMLIDDKTGELVFSVPTGPKADTLIDIRIPPGKGVAGWVAEHEQPALVPDAKVDSRFYPEIDKISGLETKSILCVPLKAKAKLIGVLEVINKTDGSSFTDADALLLNIFAYQAALAIENARLYGELEARLREEELLVQEIHHRVKNNMQVISSLLKLQSESITDIALKEIFNESQNRIQAMSLVHEKLYQSKDLVQVDLKGYIKGIAKYLYQSYRSDRNKIMLNMDVADITLSIQHAIPCGLIINELLSNSLKHAFPEGKKGEIAVALHTFNNDELELMVSDNGIGLPEDIDLETTDSLGLYLVTILVKDQLKGKITLEREEGTKFHIKFKRRYPIPRC